MASPNFYSPFKIGMFIVTLSYFLFTFHAMFTLAWWGEWEFFDGSGAFWVFISDITATVGLGFRVFASLLAFGAVLFYFVRRGLSDSTKLRILQLVLLAEAVYWMPLVVSGVMGILPVASGFFGRFAIGSLVATGIPCLVEAIVMPFALIKIVLELRNRASATGAIKWGLIAGTLYILVLWLNNMGMWIFTLLQKGTGYLFSFPENLISFFLTTIGLFVLLMFAASFVKKSAGADSLAKLNHRVAGAIIVALGLYFLWNYLSWILFDTPWSDWFAWFLGHNLDLWLLSIPLVGVPLLLVRRDS